MENKKTKSSNVSVGMGGTLIITIFVVLCLTIFATLSFTTAYSDLKLAKKTEEMTYDYYAVHGMAEEKLAEVYNVLLNSNENLNMINDDNLSETEKFFNIFADNISDVADVTVIENNEGNDNFTIYYESLGQKNQKICVTLNILYDELSKKPYYEIVSWNLANIKLPVYEEENFDLWEGID
ncbi:MAG: hypothetical protein WBJ13_07025 [Sedimentibacter sp.]